MNPLHFGYGKKPVGSNLFWIKSRKFRSDALWRRTIRIHDQINMNWMKIQNELAKTGGGYFAGTDPVEDTKALIWKKPYPGLLPDLDKFVKSEKPPFPPLPNERISEPEATANEIPVNFEPGVYPKREDIERNDWFALRTIYPDLYKAWPNISFENFQQFLIDKRK